MDWRILYIPPPNENPLSWVEEWLDIKRRRLINLSTISHHHQTLDEIAVGWFKERRKKYSNLQNAFPTRDETRWWEGRPEKFQWFDGFLCLDHSPRFANLFFVFIFFLVFATSVGIQIYESSLQGTSDSFAKTNISMDFHRSPFARHLQHQSINLLLNGVSIKNNNTVAVEEKWTERKRIYDPFNNFFLCYFEAAEVWVEQETFLIHF